MLTKKSKFGKSLPARAGASRLRAGRKRLFEGALVSGAFVAIFVLIIGLFIFQNVKMSSKRADLEKRAQELRSQVDALSAQREALEANVAETQTQEYQEKVLREQGLYQKEGEQVVTVLPPEETSTAAPEEEKKGRKWWNPFTW